MNARSRTVMSGRFGGTSIERRTMHGDAYARLKEAIMSGAIKPGELLSHRGLAMELGTSVMPIRDAVNRLVAERALEVYPNRTIGLPHRTVEQFAEISRIRCALEGLATFEAAKRIGPDDLRLLKVLAEAMRSASSYAGYMKLNQEFHFTLYAAAGMPLLKAMIETLWLQVGPLLNYMGLPSDDATIPDRHMEAIEALQRRDSAAAAAAIEADIEGARKFLSAKLGAKSAEARGKPKAPRSTKASKASKASGPTKAQPRRTAHTQLR